MSDSIPRPLEVSTVPPFLTKTFEIVDDAAVDAIVSWGSSGTSFVVWDPHEFSRLLLPLSFKHNNFSSFVRQLNTYKEGSHETDKSPHMPSSDYLLGFRKIDADKWEFANEAFQRGKRHLLKNIRRRKSSQLPSHVEPEEDFKLSGLGSEVEKLRYEENTLMMEVIELQQEHRGTAHLVEGVNKRLHSAEQKQMQMVSFFAKMVQNPSFIAKLKKKERTKCIGSSRIRRRFLTQQQQVQLESKHEAVVSDEMIGMQEYSDNQDGAAASVVETEDAFFKGKGIMGPQDTNLDLNPDYYVSLQDDLKESFTELSPTSVETMMKQEGIWNMGLDSCAGEFSDTQVGYEVPDLGRTCEMLDIWDFGSLQVGGSEIDNWPADELSFGDVHEYY